MNDDRNRASLILLLDVSRELNTTLDLRTILTRVLSLCSKNVGAERASLIVVDENLEPIDAAMIYDNEIRPPTFLRLGSVMSSGLAGWVAQNRKIAWLPDTSKDPRWLLRPDDAFDQSGPKSAICAPLLAGDQLIGVITIVHPVPGHFNTEHVELVGGIADLAALAVRNARLYSSLRVASRRYHELFEESLDPILISNWQGIIVDANRRAEEVTGHAKASLKDMMVMDLFAVSKERLGENFVELLKGDACNFETCLNPLDHSEHPIEVHVRRIDYSGAEALQWILRDITERVELDHMREDLTAMIYHDLRSPLANIVSSLDLLKTLLAEGNEDNIQSVLQIANHSVDRLQRLINSLLDINRLEAGQPITSRESCPPAKILHEAADAVQAATDSKKQTVSINPPSDDGAPQIDIDMVRRVMINLLENASKFSPGGSALELGACRQGENYLFWVKDQGPGIPPEAREMIFEKFLRLPGTRATKGLGLGLAFCRLAIQAHGGKIWVDSEPGAGSRFCFTLPVSST